MNDDILFIETQRFKQWWLWTILLGVNALLLFGVFRQIAGEQQFGDGTMGNAVLILAAGLSIIVTVIFLNFRLTTLIKKDGICVRFFPFHIRFKHYRWDDLRKCYVREYSPLTEYGGWGLRLGLFGNGKAYTISGDKGLQLQFTNDKKMLIGTQKPGELNTILTKLGQLKP